MLIERRHLRRWIRGLNRMRDLIEHADQRFHAVLLHEYALADDGTDEVWAGPEFRCLRIRYAHGPPIIAQRSLFSSTKLAPRARFGFLPAAAVAGAVFEPLADVFSFARAARLFARLTHFFEQYSWRRTR